MRSCRMFIISVFVSILATGFCDSLTDETPSGLFSLDGKLKQIDDFGSNLIAEMRVFANGGEFIGFVKEDGSFTITNVPSGSYVIEVVHPNIVFESARIDVSQKGKIRARKLNYVQPSQVVQMAYPLRLKPLAPFRYFQIREQWRITDLLFSPMVMMMILPLVLIMILPKLMSDPETQKEMQELTMPKYDMPEVSEMLTSWFAGSGSSSKQSASKQDVSRKQSAVKVVKPSKR